MKAIHGNEVGVHKVRSAGQKRRRNERRKCLYALKTHADKRARQRRAYSKAQKVRKSW